MVRGTSDTGIELKSDGDVLSDGDAVITLTGIRGNATSKDISISGATVTIGGANATGNQIINADIISFANMDARTDGDITIKPRTAATTIGISGGTCGGACILNITDTVLGLLHPDDDGNGIGSLIIGSSAAGTGVADINGWDISGNTYDVEVYGGTVDFTGNMVWNEGNSLLFNSRTGDIVLDNDFQRNAGTAGDGTITFKAAGSITSAGSHSLTTAAGGTSGKLTTIVWADAEAVPNNDGYIGLTNFNISTNGGDAVFGGGLDDGADIISATDGTTVLYNGIAADGRPDNYAWGNAVIDEGIALNNVDVLTGAGTITMRGHGRNSATGNQNGIYILNTSLIKSDTNTVLFDGKGGNAGTTNPGINLSDAGTIVRSTTGNIILNGGGGDSTGDFNYGVFIQAGATVDSDGVGASAAPITILGKGGTAGASNNNYGISIFTGSTVSSRDGDMTLTAVGASGAAVNNGFRLNNSAISSNGDANITISGTKGDVGAGDFDIGGGAITIGGVSATGLITLLANDINTFSNATVQTQNNIIFKPRTEPTSIGVSGGTCGGSCTLRITDTVLAQLHPDVDANGVGSLTIGDSSDATGTVDINGWDISGNTYDVDVYGGVVDFTGSSVQWDGANDLTFTSRAGALDIDQTFSKTAGGAGSLRFNATGAITQTAAITSTGGALNTIYDSDTDSAGAETITLSSGITTLGGNITVSDNAVLGANVAISSGAGNIGFTGTLNGAHTFSLTTTGDVTFSGAVGGITPLTAVTVTGAHDVTGAAFNAASFTRTGRYGE